MHPCIPVSQGQAGNAVQYLTRNQALKKLQLKLSEFRRLCILKGIHPREPRKKVHGANKTYYHVKDIAFLLHEPLLKKVRELATYDKKVSKALSKKNRDLAKRLASRRPGYRLDHLVRERYPSFVDALRDLDDPLTLVHLFAVLPADAHHGIPSDRVHLSRRLALEWQAWVARAHALRRVFVSVKGYYYQAEVQGQAVTWLVPHQLTQVLPPDVDFKVMLTFLELYQTTLQFVMYKLYRSIGLKYPPVIDEDLEEGAAAGLQAVMADAAGGGKKAAAGAAGNAAGDKNVGKAGADGDKVGKRVNPEAAARLSTLSAKVAELEAEIQAMGQRPEEEDGTVDEEESADEDDELEIDSGDEDEEESENEDAGDDDDQAASDPEDEDIPLSDGAKEAAASDALPPDPTLLGGAVNVDVEDDAAVCSTLFRGLTFFLSREVPREQLLLVIKAFGGEAGWEGEESPLPEDADSITHHIVDRPALRKSYPNREFVQPQWVFDSANARVLVRTQLYAPGQAPPPHLSPFVTEDEDGYMPEYGKEIKQLQEAAKAARRRAAGIAEEGAFLDGDGGRDGDGEGATALNEEEELRAAERRHAVELARELRAGGEGGEGGSDGEEWVEVGAAAGQKRVRPDDDGEGDEDAMKAVMMTRKVRRMYQQVKKNNAEKRSRVEELEARAAALKKKKGGAAK